MAVFHDALSLLHRLIQAFAEQTFSSRNRCGILNRAILGNLANHVHLNSQPFLNKGRACYRVECSHDSQIVVTPSILHRSSNHDLGNNFEPQNEKIQN